MAYAKLRFRSGLRRCASEAILQATAILRAARRCCVSFIPHSSFLQAVSRQPLRPESNIMSIDGLDSGSSVSDSCSPWRLGGWDPNPGIKQSVDSVPGLHQSETLGTASAIRSGKRDSPGFPSLCALCGQLPSRGFDSRSAPVCACLRLRVRTGYGVVRYRSRGKKLAWRTLSRSSICWVRRSVPMASPPCGGMPSRKISR